MQICRAIATTLGLAIIAGMLQAQATTKDGTLAFVYTGHLCSKLPTFVQTSVKLFPDGRSRNQVEKVYNGGSSLVVPAGIYWVRIEGESCLAEFPIAAFSGVTRFVPVSLRSIKRGESEEQGGAADIYISYGDAFMIDLPFDGMSITAKMDNGRPLATSIQNRRAFIDNVPAGRIFISARGANFGESQDIISSGEHQMHIVNLETAPLGP